MKIFTLLLFSLFFGALPNHLFSQTQAEIEAMAKEEKPSKTKEKKVNISKELKVRAKQMAKEEREEKKEATEKEDKITKVKKPKKEKTTTAKPKAKKEKQDKVLVEKERKTKSSKTREPKQAKVKKEKKSTANLASENENVNTEWTKFGRKKLIKKGDKLLKSGSNEKALEAYEAAWYKTKKAKQKVGLGEKLANLNYDLKNYKKAEKYYSQSIELNTNHKKFPLLEYQLANTYKYQAKYDKAITLYNTFTKLQAENDKVKAERRRARIEKKGAEYAQELSTEDLKYTIRNAGENVNGDASETAPEFNGENLFFAKNSDSNFSKIYFSEFHQDEFSVFQDFADNINISENNISNPSFSADGNTVYFTNCDANDKCQILKSERVNNEWQQAEVLNKNINKEESSNTQAQIATLPSGEEALFFVSDRIGSKGGKDLWMSSKKEDGDFGKATRLKTPVNTTYDELSPYYNAATNTLYFSSNGHVNIGGFDVFKVENFFENDDDLVVQNMGYPINSSLDDYDFILNNNEELGFIASNRSSDLSLESETSNEDIFIVETTEVNLYVKTMVYAENETSRKLYDAANLILYNAKTDEKIEPINKDEDQVYFIQVEKDMSYKIVAEADDFEETKISFSTDGIKKSDTLQYDVFLKERKLENHLVAKIYYQFNSSNLRADAPDTLKKVINFMNAYPDIIIEVGSHTDSKGSDAYNLALGERRSMAVMNYLIKMGKIAEERLKNKSYGETSPAAPNKNEDGSDSIKGRDLNRRTEFKVIGKLPTKK